MYTKLMEALNRMGIPYSRLAKMVNMPTSTMHDKIHGLTSFTLEEAERIKAALNIEMTIEELFKKKGAS